MITYSPMLPEDIYRLDFVNLDNYSENFTTEYYLNKMQESPFNFFCARIYNSIDNSPSPNNLNSLSTSIYGYIFGTKTRKAVECIVNNKSTGRKKMVKTGKQMNALSVSPFCRKLGIGDSLIRLLIKESKNSDFIKLFVRKNNRNAIRFYENRGFQVYRSIIDYYNNPDEDAYEMIKGFKFVVGRVEDIKSAYLSNEE